MELHLLTDDELLVRTKSLARKERIATLNVIKHLQEIEIRKLQLARGFSSLYEYTIKELGFSEGSAYRRLQVMKLLRDIPNAEKKIEEGELSLNTAALIQNACSRNPDLNKAELVEKLAGQNAREVARALACEGKPGRERVRWIGSELVSLTLILSKTTFDELEELKAIKSHSPFTESYSSLVEELVKLGQSKWNPARRTASSQRRSGAKKSASKTPTSPTPNSASPPQQPPPNPPAPRAIPNSLRREIWVRDKARCSYIDPLTKRPCESNHYVQIDHIRPVALGGKSEASNLRLLCAQHNRERASQTFGKNTH